MRATPHLALSYCQLHITPFFLENSHNTSMYKYGSLQGKLLQSNIS